MSLLTDILCNVTDSLRLKLQLEAKCLAAKFEDSAKSLHDRAKHLCFAFAMLLFCIALLTIGVVFILWGSFALLASVLNPGFAALIVGSVVILIAIIVLFIVKKSLKPSK